MMPMHVITKTFLTAAVAIVALLSSCEYTGYDTGDTALSYYTSEMANLTIRNSVLTAITLDDDTQLLPPDDYYVGESIPADTMMRCLIGYTQKDASEPITLINATSVMLPDIVSGLTDEERKTDPLKLTAAWLSANRSYVNMNLGLMTGNDRDAEQYQSLKIIADSLSDEGAGTIYLTLYHDQNDQPEYFTETVYASLTTTFYVLYPGEGMRTFSPDTICLDVNTYDGVERRRFVMSK